MLSKLASLIWRRRTAYRRAFLRDDGQLNADGELIIADLVKFCRHNRSAMVISPQSQQTDVPATFQVLGRQEVLARILGNLHVSDADLVRMSERMEDHE